MGNLDLAIPLLKAISTGRVVDKFGSDNKFYSKITFLIKNPANPPRMSLLLDNI